jgi:hypothetical protein
MPALASALRDAGIGPSSMRTGSSPTLATARIRARGLQPELLAPWPLSRSGPPPRRRRCPRVAGVVDVLDALDLRVARPGERIERQTARPSSNDGASLRARRAWCRGAGLVAVEQRRCPLNGSRTAKASLEKAPRRPSPAAAFCWLRTAKASASSRVMPCRVASRSALMPCGTMPRVAKAMCGLINAPPSLPIATRDMLSTPPAMTRSARPRRPAPPRR